MHKVRKRGLVPISGDPITYGHLDLIIKASFRCEELIVSVLMNDKKERSGAYLFTLAERKAMAERAVRQAGIKNARVICSSGLLVDVYLREGCDILYRGVRDAKDRAYEREQKELNQLILASVEFEIIDSPVELRMISSSMVKEFVSHGLDVDRFVPMFVKRSLEERLLGQYRIAVTGSIAVGKSWVAAELVRQANANRVSAGLFNLDDLVRKLYAEDSEGAKDVRNGIQALCGRRKVLAKGGDDIDRKALAACLFQEEGDATALREAVTMLTMPHIARLYRDMLRGFKGLVVVEWAQLAEMHMSPWTNDNAIVVDSPDRRKFRRQRGIDGERSRVMERIQWSTKKKVEGLRWRVDAHGNGEVIVFQNRFHANEIESKKAVTALRKKVFALFPGMVPPKT